MKNKISRYALYFILLLVGIFIGKIFFSPAAKTSMQKPSASAAQTWTCAMHPQVRKDAAGKCPLCGMDLILLQPSHASAATDNSVHFSQEAAALAQIGVSTVSRQSPTKSIRLYGRVQVDERSLQKQAAHVSGRIEKLFINFTGEKIRRGQNMAVIYSPELATAQQELLETAKTKDSQPQLYEASKEKLRLLKLTDSQISEIEKSGKAEYRMTIVATVSGIVLSKKIDVGDYVNAGDLLFEAADLSHVWVLFDAYEHDIAFLQTGDKLKFRVEAFPGKEFAGEIKFIDPLLDNQTRISKVRVHAANPVGLLKPEMAATGMAEAALTHLKNKIVIPASAVLWTGKRSVVYVQSGEEPIFTMREIELGASLGDSYAVNSGLKDGEKIVAQGAFSIDAAAQLEGKPSMMTHEFQTENTPIQEEKKSIQFKVFGNCEMCKERIESSLKILGVQSADWNVNTKMVSITYNPRQANPDALRKAIANAGHDTDKIKTDKAIYNELPECCRYKDKENAD